MAGLETHPLVFSEPSTPDIVNLYARIGSEAHCLVFADHIDAMPRGDISVWRLAPLGDVVEDAAPPT